jgi:hypothetical protein
VGHIGIKGLHSTVDGLSLDNSTSLSCKTCAHANIIHSPFSLYASHCSQCLLEHVHCDICESLPCCYGNFTYYILFIDNYSHFIILFLMKTCGEACSLFAEFQKAAKNFCSEKICFLCIDNASKLIHNDLNSHCKAHSISYKKTIPDSLAQNGIAKCTNLTICSMAYAMLINMNLHNFFWLFAVLTATHIKQCLLHASLLANVMPFQLWFKR